MLRLRLRVAIGQQAPKGRAHVLSLIGHIRTLAPSPSRGRASTSPVAGGTRTYSSTEPEPRTRQGIAGDGELAADVGERGSARRKKKDGPGEIV